MTTEQKQGWFLAFCSLFAPVIGSLIFTWLAPSKSGWSDQGFTFILVIWIISFIPTLSIFAPRAAKAFEGKTIYFWEFLGLSILVCVLISSLWILIVLPAAITIIPSALSLHTVWAILDFIKLQLLITGPVLSIGFYTSVSLWFVARIFGIVGRDVKPSVKVNVAIDGQSAKDESLQNLIVTERNDAVE